MTAPFSRFLCILVPRVERGFARQEGLRDRSTRGIGFYFWQIVAMAGGRDLMINRELLIVWMSDGKMPLP
jgi:hypothetical protein